MFKVFLKHHSALVRYVQHSLHIESGRGRAPDVSRCACIKPDWRETKCGLLMAKLCAADFLSSEERVIRAMSEGRVAFIQKARAEGEEGMEKEGQARISRGCFFCKSGKESDVINRFFMAFPDGQAISPTRTRIRRAHDAAIEERVPLLPGYVFFQITEKESEVAEAIDANLIALLQFTRIDSVLKLLRYSDGTWRLFGTDDLFAEMLFKSGGNIELSQAYFDRGNRIRILDGFLKNYEGHITNVNRKKKTVEVTVDLQGKRVIMWLGYELVEPVPDRSERVSKEK